MSSLTAAEVWTAASSPDTSAQVLLLIADKLLAQVVRNFVDFLFLESSVRLWEDVLGRRVRGLILKIGRWLHMKHLQGVSCRLRFDFGKYGNQLIIRQVGALIQGLLSGMIPLVDFLTQVQEESTTTTVLLIAHNKVLRNYFRRQLILVSDIARIICFFVTISHNVHTTIFEGRIIL